MIYLNVFEISLIVLILSSLIHLYSSYKKIIYLRNISKIFILPSLIALYYSKVLVIDNTFLLALFFSWLGDLLLIIRGNLFFSIGGISFCASHIFFIISFSKYITNISNVIVIIIVASIIYYLSTCITFKHLTKYLPKPLIIPMFIYLLANASMNCSAFALLLTNKTLPSLIVYIGALSFFISDTNLFFVRFKKEYKDQNHFIVMLTYIIAESLIVIGMLNI